MARSIHIAQDDLTRKCGSFSLGAEAPPSGERDLAGGRTQEICIVKGGAGEHPKLLAADTDRPSLLLRSGQRRGLE